MPEDSDLYKVSVDVGLGQDPLREEPSREDPFDILVLGDFTGRETRELLDPDAALREREPLRVDADNVLSMGGWEARIELSWAGLGPESPEGSFESVRGFLPLRFGSLEDFHPDRLIDQVPMDAVARWLGAREEGKQPAEGSIEEHGPPEGGGPPRGEQAARPAPPEAGPGPLPSGREVLDSILDSSPGESPEPDSVYRDGLRAFLERVTAPHLVPPEEEGAVHARNRLERAGALLLDLILHHPGFQDLERLWRSLLFLVARARPGPDLRIHLVDVSKEELRADAESHENLQDSALYHRLVEASSGTLGAPRWALVVGAYSFGPTPHDLSLLFHIAAVSHLAEAPWFSAAEPHLAGFTSFAGEAREDGSPPPTAWSAFRESGFARSLGLVAPRFLLRLPYGAETDPVERLPYEEANGSPRHEELLWGNGAFAAAALIAESYRDEGWRLRPERHLGLSGLPLYLGAGGEGKRALQPCAEALLSDRQAARILERGIMPLRSVKGTDQARLQALRSVAREPEKLHAWWASQGG